MPENCLIGERLQNIAIEAVHPDLFDTFDRNVEKVFLARNGRCPDDQPFNTAGKALVIEQAGTATK